MTPEFIRSWWKFVSEPSPEMWIGLIVAFLFSGMALLGLIRLHFTSRTITPLVMAPAGSSHFSDPTSPMSDSAQLKIAFDNTGYATVIEQHGVRSYHYYFVPSVKLDWSTRIVDAETPGSVLIFLDFNNPTHTENSRVSVDGKVSDNARVMSNQPTSAIVSAVGDMHNTTVDIRFSKDRILN